MSIISIYTGVEDNVGVIPSQIYINTNDSLATVMSTGYLNGRTDIVFKSTQLALVNTTSGVIPLNVSVSGSTISLIAIPSS